jgi:hypothetical protein
MTDSEKYIEVEVRESDFLFFVSLNDEEKQETFTSMQLLVRVFFGQYVGA